MQLNHLPKVKKNSSKRISRGLGSGKGKTGGRGSKGQKARGKVPIGFVGSLPLYKKLPLVRGKGNRKKSTRSKVINLSDLNVFPAKTIIDLPKLIEAKVVTQKQASFGVKILGKGEITKALTVKLPLSKSAQQKIESSGGKVENG
ncbi:50S ribosomal protein L15 [Candidatus Daviesbacteria bacterium]|nr:50S ribosomal protein L15 [Candidatus Daviesbacteria bacterium]